MAITVAERNAIIAEAYEAAAKVFEKYAIDPIRPGTWSGAAKELRKTAKELRDAVAKD